MYVCIQVSYLCFANVYRTAVVKEDDSEDNSSTGNPIHTSMRKSSSNYLPTISRSTSSTSKIHTYIHTYIYTYILVQAFLLLSTHLSLLFIALDCEPHSPQKSALDNYNVMLHIHTYIHTYIHTPIHRSTFKQKLFHT